MKYTTLIERYVIVKCRLNEARVRTTNSKGETKKKLGVHNGEIRDVF